jgi:crossover junction endodeoxyribonuclease RuvC
MERATTTTPVVLGIDPGTRVVGYGAVALRADGPRLLSAGVVRLPAKMPVAERLAAIHARFEELMRTLRPAVVVVERAFAAKNIASALRIGGLALACAAAAKAEVVELAPRAAKKRVAGSGDASKEQVAAMVKRALGRDDLDLPLDATDALALALAHATRPALLVPAGARRASATRKKGAAGLPEHVLASALRARSAPLDAGPAKPRKPAS